MLTVLQHINVQEIKFLYHSKHPLTYITEVGICNIFVSV